MSSTRHAIAALPALLVLGGVLGVGGPAKAQVTAPSVYTTAIQVQGEAAGTEFDDWATSGITIADMDSADNLGSIDIADIQVANDSNFIYIHATMHNETPVSFLNLFLGIDTDQDTATGWDIFELGEIGSDVGYQNDFPFHQSEFGFNSGLAFTGGPIGNGGALIYPFWTESGPPEGIEFEWAVPLDAVIQFPPGLGGPAPAFPNASFDFVVYTDQGIADITQVISYTLAASPFPAGDFDEDGDVDLADAMEWQRGYGTLYDDDDYNLWVANFPTGEAPPLLSATTTAAPEPGSFVLFSLAAMGMSSFVRVGH